MGRGRGYALAYLDFIHRTEHVFLFIAKFTTCRHFKEKMRNLGRKEETKWNLLVCKVLERGGTMRFMPGRRKNFINPKASWELPRGSSCI
jgi:hypothetical protein